MAKRESKDRHLSLEMAEEDFLKWKKLLHDSRRPLIHVKCQGKDLLFTAAQNFYKEEKVYLEALMFVKIRLHNTRHESKSSLCLMKPSLEAWPRFPWPWRLVGGQFCRWLLHPSITSVAREKSGACQNVSTSISYTFHVFHHPFFFQDMATTHKKHI